MKINKVNAKIFASALSFVMSTSFVGGCSKLHSYEYVENSEGKTELEGEFFYSEIIENGRVIEVSLFDKKDVYIVRKMETRNYYASRVVIDYYYYDILNNHLLLKTDTDGIVAGDTQIKIINEYQLSDYLVYYDEIKNKYNKDDLERILEKIKSDYVFENIETKILLKERI